MQKTILLLAKWAFLILILSVLACNTAVMHEPMQHLISSKQKFISVADAHVFEPSWSTENTVVCHVVSEPDGMHPTNGTSSMRSEVMAYTQLYLIGMDYKDFKFIPVALISMPTVSADEKEYTYELRNDVKFDDGSLLTAEDVAFTFKANKCPLTNNPVAKAYLNNIKSVVVDPQHPLEFKILWKEKYMHAIGILADFPLMQRTFFDKNNVLAKYTFEQFDEEKFKADETLNKWGINFNDVKYSRNPLFLAGAGPYQLTNWDAGQSITLVRKKNQSSVKSNLPFQEAYPDKIIFKINKDKNAQLLEFKSQVVDVSSQLTSEILLALQADSEFNKNYNSYFLDAYGYQYMAMNTKPDGEKHKNLFTDKKVRRAMAMLMPLDDINKILSKGNNKRIIGPVSPLKDSYNTELKPILFDIEGAKNLLTKAGWIDNDGDGIRNKMIAGENLKFEFTIAYMTTSAYWKSCAVLIAEQMYKAGIKAIIKPMEAAALYAAARSHDFDMMLASMRGSSLTDDFTDTWHTAAWLTNGLNYSGFGNLVSDALIDSIKHASDEVIRDKMIKKLQAIIYDEQPCVFLFSATTQCAIHKRFGNQELYFERPVVWLSHLKLLPSIKNNNK
ncbi:MAG: ABC transporter substrate-binding protein [Bacteroidia bacterium]